MQATPGERTASALAALAIMLLATAALIFGLKAGDAARGPDAIVSVFLDPIEPTPEPTPKPTPSSSPAAKDAPAPAGRRDSASPVLAPLVVPLILPPPIVTAPKPASGTAAIGGASEGSGQGGGGVGSGWGGGGSAEGDGGGIAVQSRQTGGRLPRNLSQGLLQLGEEARVQVRYTVDVRGRAVGCRPDQPGLLPELDARTCREIERRFRFAPARDRRGVPVPDVIVEGYVFYFRDADAPPEY